MGTLGKNYKVLRMERALGELGRHLLGALVEEGWVGTFQPALQGGWARSSRAQFPPARGWGHRALYGPAGRSWWSKIVRLPA